MNNKELIEIIKEFVDDDVADSIIILDGDEFADAAIGLTVDNRVVYDYDLMVQSLAKAYKEGDEVTDDDITNAVDDIEYNTIPSIPTMSHYGIAPIIIRRFK